MINYLELTRILFNIPDNIKDTEIDEYWGTTPLILSNYLKKLFTIYLSKRFDKVPSDAGGFRCGYMKSQVCQEIPTGPAPKEFQEYDLSLVHHCIKFKLCNTNNYNKILLTGKKFSGKSTVAKYLCDKYNYTELTIAEPLKRISQILFNLSDEQLNNHELKEEIDIRWSYSPRQIFQILGDLLRDDLPTIFTFIDFTKYKIFIYNINRRLANVKYNVVISDGRIYDEIAWFNELTDNLSININRPISGTSSSDKHHTENLNIPVDFQIINDKSLAELYNTVDTLVCYG